MNYTHSEGLIAATFTPFHQNGEVNLSIIPQYAHKLKQDGVMGVFVCGSSGEGLLMNIEERKAVAEAWIPYADENFRVIIHVGSTSIKISKELSAHASSIGANAIGCMGPCCFQPKDIQSLIGFCKEVANEAPKIPFYYYHIPGTSGVHLKMDEFLLTANKVIPNLAGIKYTSMDLMEMLFCSTLEDKKFDIIHGHDETLLAGLAFGAKAAIGTTYNFMAPLFNELINQFNDKNLDKALEIQKLANKIIKIMLLTGSPISGGKAIMKLSGIDCGPCRLPLSNLSDLQIVKLREKLDDAGYFDLT